MAATERLYLDSIQSGYYTDFNAHVEAVEGDVITLDRTLFYPLGGGQNWDTGTLEGPNGIIDVHEVRGRTTISHKVDASHTLSVGDEVQGSINWERRHAHMRMHTAQHLVSGVVYELFDGVRTVGNQIHHDRSRIDFNPVSFTQDMLDEVTHQVNSLIDAKHEVTDSTMTRQQVNGRMPPERTNMDLYPHQSLNFGLFKSVKTWIFVRVPARMFKTCLKSGILPLSERNPRARGHNG